VAINLFNDARTKIYAIALVHSQLYQTERLDRIEMKQHVAELVNNIAIIYGAGKRITPVTNVRDLYLTLSEAIPCSLILSELITNVYKHAFKDRQAGVVEISLQGTARNSIMLSVKDNGIGLPAEVDIYKTNSLGIKLVRNLIRHQLRGELKVKRDGGTEFILTFKHLEEVKQ